MNANNAIRAFDTIVLRLFHIVVVVGLGAAAFGAVAQSFTA